MHSLVCLTASFCVWSAGKNRPLDDDELEFVNDMLDRERKNDSRQAQEESQELEAYRQVCLTVLSVHIQTLHSTILRCFCMSLHVNLLHAC